MSKPPVDKVITDSLHWWERSAIILRAFWAFLTILSILCSVLVGGSSATSVAASSSTGSASQFGFLEGWQVAVLSITAAIAVGIMSALDIRGNADRMRRAWRMLNVAVVKYSSDPNYTVQQLNQAYSDAEDIISAK